MSDYLNSLVTRTLRLGPVVQPRPASLFEPVAAAPVNEAAFAVSETRAAPDSPSPEQLTFQPAKAPSHQNEVGAASEPSQAIHQHPIVRALPTQPLRPALFSMSEKESTRTVGGENLPPPAAESEATTPAPQTRRDSPVIKPEVRIFSPETDRDPVQPSLTTPSLAPVSSARPEPASRNLNTVPQTPLSAETPDTVIVTIGRVDVRAIFPPAQTAPRAARTQPQAMSLDEYLKQRSEGRR